MDEANQAILREMSGTAARATSIISLEQWQEYFFLLEGPQGCNFDMGPPMTWECAGGTDQSRSKSILESMGFNESTVNEVLQCVSSLGGHCDCEVLFNAAERIDP